MPPSRSTIDGRNKGDAMAMIQITGVCAKLQFQHYQNICIIMYTHAENAERTPCAQRPFSQCTLSATIDFLLRFFVCLKVFVYLLAVHNPCIRIIIVQVNADKVIRREKKQQQLNSRSMKNSTLFQQQQQLQQQNTFSPIVSFYSFILFLLFFILASFGTKCSEYLQLICALSS